MTTGPRILGTLMDKTLVILTPAESRLLRAVLSGEASVDRLALEAFNRGVKRGTERLLDESRAATAKR